MNFEKESVAAYNRAIAEYTDAIRSNPTDTSARRNRAGLYLEAADWDNAIADCTSILEHDPRSADCYHTRGKAYLGKGEYAKAIEDQTKALVYECEGLWEDSYYWRGLSYLKSGDYFSAIADFDRADSPSKLLADVLRNRAMAYEAIGEHDAAVRDLQRLEAKALPPPPELIALITGLIDGWCERRALGPLKGLLPDWPVSKGLNDEWRRLRHALGYVQSVARKSITNEEVELLVEARKIIDQAILGRS